MLGLISVALLLLACSYWRLSGHLIRDEDNDRDLEEGDSNEGDESQADLKKAAPIFEEKFLVIMAGHEKPTCLATPMSSRASSFGATSKSSCSCQSNAISGENREKLQENGVHVVQMESFAMNSTSDHPQ